LLRLLIRPLAFVDGTLSLIKLILVKAVLFH